MPRESEREREKSAARERLRRARKMGSTRDAWDDVEDLEGTLHYDVLGLERNASADDVRRAYRSKARLHHPDKAGGDAETFARVKKAYDVLGDPDRRKVYDEWQRNVEFRHVRGVASRFEGGEDLMLDEFEKYLNHEGLEVLYYNLKREIDLSDFSFQHS